MIIISSKFKIHVQILPQLIAENMQRFFFNEFVWSFLSNQIC